MNNNSKKIISLLGASAIMLSSCSNKKNKDEVVDNYWQYIPVDTTTSDTYTPSTSEETYTTSTKENTVVTSNTTIITGVTSISDTTYETYDIDTTYEITMDTTNDVINTTTTELITEEVTTTSNTTETTSLEDTTYVTSALETTDETTYVTSTEETTTEEVVTVNEEEVEELNEEELIVALENYEVIIINEALNGTKESLKDKLDRYFTATVGFIFCDEPIKGKRLKDLSDSAKVKITSIANNINDTIEIYYPDYKITLKDKFNNAKEWSLDKLKKAASILKDDAIEIMGQDKFDKLKTNYEKAKNLIKDLGSQAIDGIKDLAEKGIEKIKNWYNNKTR